MRFSDPRESKAGPRVCWWGLGTPERCTHAMSLPSLLWPCSRLSLSPVSWLRYSQKPLCTGLAEDTAGGSGAVVVLPTQPCCPQSPRARTHLGRWPGGRGAAQPSAAWSGCRRDRRGAVGCSECPQRGGASAAHPLAAPCKGLAPGAPLKTPGVPHNTFGSPKHFGYPEVLLLCTWNHTQLLRPHLTLVASRVPPARSRPVAALI